VIVNGDGGNLFALIGMVRELREQVIFVSIFQWWSAADKLLPDIFKAEEKGHAGLRKPQ